MHAKDSLTPFAPAEVGQLVRAMAGALPSTAIDCPFVPISEFVVAGLMRRARSREAGRT
jgi:hypothetical protein